MILHKLDSMEFNYKNSLEKMMDTYMTKLTFLETELIKLELLVKKSLKGKEISPSIKDQKHDIKVIKDFDTYIEQEASEVGGDQDIEENYEVQMEDYVTNESFLLKNENLAEGDGFEDGQIIISQEFSDVLDPIQEDISNNIAKSDDMIFMVKRRKTELKKPENLISLQMIPVNTEDELKQLDQLLDGNEIEKQGFIEFLNKTKFTNGLKSAFTEIISEVLLLDYNYSGKGLIKKALNQYKVFNEHIFGEF
jgi:hypothetical protein